jgi:hypothetical protein
MIEPILINKPAFPAETAKVSERATESFRSTCIRGHLGASALLDVFENFFIETGEQVQDQETVQGKVGIIGTALLAAGGQLWDRGRGTEAIGIPLAIEIYERNQSATAGAASFALMTYGVQGLVGAGWGMGINRFKKTATMFDNSFPGYAETLSEENAGYTKTLFRHSITGLGTGNTPFVAAEMLSKPDSSIKDATKIAEKTARRLAFSTGVISYGVLRIAEEYFDKSIGIPGVADITVPQLVEHAKQPKTWLLLGLLLELGPKTVAKPMKVLANKIGSNRRLNELSKKTGEHA